MILNLIDFLLTAQVVDLRNKRRTLSTACLSETGGLGIDCVLDNKGNENLIILILITI